MDKEWRREMVSLRDSMFECPDCEAENFFNIDRVKRKQPLDACWSCGRVPKLPPRMRISGKHEPILVVLGKGAQLFPHHLEGDEYNFTTVLAEVVMNPLSLKNVSGKIWTATRADGSSIEVPHGGSLVLSDGCRVHFGRSDAEIKL